MEKPKAKTLVSLFDEEEPRTLHDRVMGILENMDDTIEIVEHSRLGDCGTIVIEYKEKSYLFGLFKKSLASLSDVRKQLSFDSKVGRPVIMERDYLRYVDMESGESVDVNVYS